MGNYTIFGGSKILGEAGKQEILQKCFENSRSQIVFRTDIFRKLTLGAPVLCTTGWENTIQDVDKSTNMPM